MSYVLKTRKKAWGVALGVLLAYGSNPAHAQWRELGPAPINSGGHGGRVTSIAAHPSDADTFYIGAASGGVWRYDGSWTPLTDQMPSLTIGALALDPNQPNTLYAGTGESNLAPHCFYGVGLYKSTDAGKTWAILGADTFAGRSIARVVVAPSDSNVLYVALQRAGGIPVRYAAKDHPLADAELGVFRSDDAGVTWAHLTADRAQVGASDVVVDPKDAQVVYAALGGFEANAEHGVYKSTDGGTTWNVLDPFSETLGRVSLGMSSDGATVYALAARGASADSPQGATLIDLMKSSDGGQNWDSENISDVTSGFGWYMNVVAVHPDDANDVFYGGMTLMRGNADVTPQHVDIHAVAWDASGRLLVGDDGGVHRSEDNGSSYQALNDGLGINQFYPSVSVNGNDADFLLGGLQDNGTNLWDGSTWSQVLGGDGGYTAIHPTQPEVLFAEIQHTGALYRSSDGGQSFVASADGIDSSDRDAFFNPIVFHPTQPDTLLYATQRLYRSTNGGQSWQPFSQDLTGGAALSAIRTLAYAPSDPNTVWVVTTDGLVQVSGDGGETFELVNEGLADWRRVSRDLAILPDDPDSVFVGVPRFGVDQVLKTSDRGKSWQAIDGNLPDVPVNALEVHVAADGSRFLFAGTDNELYISCDEGGRWTELDASFPNALVVEVRYQAQLERVVAITMGRGAWLYEGASETKLSGICEAGSDTDTDTVTDTDSGTDSGTHATTEASGTSEAETSTGTPDETGATTGSADSDATTPTSADNGDSVTSGESEDDLAGSGPGCSCASSGSDGQHQTVRVIIELAGLWLAAMLVRRRVAT